MQHKAPTVGNTGCLLEKAHCWPLPAHIEAHCWSLKTTRPEPALSAEYVAGRPGATEILVEMRIDSVMARKPMPQSLAARRHGAGPRRRGWSIHARLDAKRVHRQRAQSPSRILQRRLLAPARLRQQKRPLRRSRRARKARGRQPKKQAKHRSIRTPIYDDSEDPTELLEEAPPRQQMCPRPMRRTARPGKRTQSQRLRNRPPKKIHPWNTGQRWSRSQSLRAKLRPKRNQRRKPRLLRRS